MGDESHHMAHAGRVPGTRAHTFVHTSSKKNFLIADTFLVTRTDTRLVTHHVQRGPEYKMKVRWVRWSKPWTDAHFHSSGQKFAKKLHFYVATIKWAVMTALSG
jgi:hypothetical protein